MRRPSGNDSNALLTRATNFWGRPLGAAESLTAPHFQGDTAPRGSNGSRCDSVGTRCCLPPTASSRDVHRAEADAVSGSAPQMKPRSSRGSEQPRDRGGRPWPGTVTRLSTLDGSTDERPCEQVPGGTEPVSPAELLVPENPGC